MTTTESDSNHFLDRSTTASQRAQAKLECQISKIEALVDAALAEARGEATPRTKPQKPKQISIWGVPYSYLSMADTLQHIDQLIEWGEPGYFITANLNYNMLTAEHTDLRSVNDQAAFILCDGMPMVRYSQWVGKPLPERVAGSELIYALTKWSAAKGHRVFFLGGAPGVAQAAADNLVARYPGLQVAGVESPPFRPLTSAEEESLITSIRQTNPDIIYVAFGQPKGEFWIAKHFRALGAPACVQLGASFDFVAGGVARAPMWIQSAGLEWLYRLLQEPQRLTGRYWKNGVFLLKELAKGFSGQGRSS